MLSPAGPAGAALPADASAPAPGRPGERSDHGLPTVANQPERRIGPDDDPAGRRRSVPDEPDLRADDAAAKRRLILEDGHSQEDEGAGRRRSLEDDEAGRRWGLAEDQAARRRSTGLDDEAEQRLGNRVARSGDSSPLRPGDIGETSISFWGEEATQHFRSEWHEVKADFVDDPVTALTRAHDLLTDAVNQLTESLLAERDELDPLHTTASPDTESMRMAMRGYREFLDRILAL
jgi:hypothetical protein